MESVQRRVPAECVDLFRNPARLLVAGYSNSGKTEFVTKLITKYSKRFYKIIVSGVDKHPLQSNPEISPKLELHEGIIDIFEEVNESEDERGILYVLDDLFFDALEDKTVMKSYTRGRHANISVILITQNLFARGKYARDISLNASHFVLHKMRDLNQIETLGRQLFGKSGSRQMVDIYKKATKESYGYLLVDVAPGTPDYLTFRSRVVGLEPEIVYQWKP